MKKTMNPAAMAAMKKGQKSTGKVDPDAKVDKAEMKSGGPKKSDPDYKNDVKGMSKRAKGIAALKAARAKAGK